MTKPRRLKNAEDEAGVPDSMSERVGSTKVTLWKSDVISDESIDLCLVGKLSRQKLKVAFKTVSLETLRNKNVLRIRIIRTGWIYINFLYRTFKGVCGNHTFQGLVTKYKQYYHRVALWFDGVRPIGKEEFRFGNVFTEGLTDIVDGLVRVGPDEKHKLGSSNHTKSKWTLNVRQHTLD